MCGWSVAGSSTTTRHMREFPRRLRASRRQTADCFEAWLAPATRVHEWRIVWPDLSRPFRTHRPISLELCSRPAAAYQMIGHQRYLELRLPTIEYFACTDTGNQISCGHDTPLPTMCFS